MLCLWEVRETCVCVNSVCAGEVDVPALISILLGMYLRYYKAAAIILLMVTGGEALENYAMERAGQDLNELFTIGSTR